MRGHHVKTKVAAITLAFTLLLLQTPFSVLADTEIRFGMSGASLGNSGEIVEFKLLEEDVRLQNVAPGTQFEDLVLPEQLAVSAIEDEEELEGYIDVQEWVCDKEYDPELIGVYFFSPEISSGWVLADYAVKPKITVTISPVMAASASVEIWDGSIATGFAGGDGSESNPYQISNGAELAYLAQETNSSSLNTYYGNYFELISDIYLNGDKYINEWIPIGRGGGYTFQGNINGNGNTVFGVYIDNPTIDYRGLFGYLYYGRFENLGIADSSIKGKEYVGALAGKTAYGSFNNIKVSNNTVNGTKYVGGVTGSSERVSELNNISNLSGSIIGGDYVGGISGGIFGKSDDYTIDTIYNNASVSGIGAVSYAGGIFGTMNDGYLSNSINYANVTGYMVGGLVSTTHPASYVGNYKFINCENYGIIQGMNAGGIVGRTYDVYANRKLSIVQSNNWGAVNGASSAGGIVGSTTDIIEDCVNNGPVTGRDAGGITSSSYGSTVRCYNLGTISGIDHAGGIVCYKGSDGNISNCGNVGNVSGNTRVGGIVGYYTSGGSISQCYNTGKIEGTGTSVGGLIGTNYSPISDCYSTGNVTGVNYVGGLVGLNGAAIVTNSYSSGKVVGTGSRVGGLIGEYSHSLTTGITNTYYLESSRTNGIGNLGNDVISGLSPISDFHLRFLAPTLGEAFTTDTEYVNKGFPILVGLKYDFDDIIVTNYTLDIAVWLDKGYMNHSSSNQPLADAMEIMENSIKPFRTTYGIEANILGYESTEDKYVFPADNCPKPYQPCDDDCGQVCVDTQNVLENTHHKNWNVNLAALAIYTDDNDGTVINHMLTGYALCSQGENTSLGSGHSFTVSGLAYLKGNHSMISATYYSNRKSHVIRTSQHELSHNLGTDSDRGNNLCSEFQECVMTGGFYNEPTDSKNIWCDNCFTKIQYAIDTDNNAVKKIGG